MTSLASSLNPIRLRRWPPSPSCTHGTHGSYPLDHQQPARVCGSYRDSCHNSTCIQPNGHEMKHQPLVGDHKVVCGGHGSTCCTADGRHLPIPRPNIASKEGLCQQAMDQSMYDASNGYCRKCRVPGGVNNLEHVFRAYSDPYSCVCGAFPTAGGPTLRKISTAFGGGTHTEPAKPPLHTNRHAKATLTSPPPGPPPPAAPPPPPPPAPPPPRLPTCTRARHPINENILQVRPHCTLLSQPVPPPC